MTAPTRGRAAQITDVAPIWLLLLRDRDGSNATPSRYPGFPPLGALSLRGREPPGGTDTGRPPGYAATAGPNPHKYETRSTEGPGRVGAVRSTPLRTRQRSARRHERLCFLYPSRLEPAPLFGGNLATGSPRSPSRFCERGCRTRHDPLLSIEYGPAFVLHTVVSLKRTTTLTSR